MRSILKVSLATVIILAAIPALLGRNAAGRYFASQASGSPLAADDARLSVTDVFNLEFASDPQISPDGRRVVYVRQFADIMSDKRCSNLWIINFDGTDNR